MRALSISSVLVLALLALGCGPVGVGGECYSALSESGCVAGSFCTPVRTGPVSMGPQPRWDTAVCRVLCEGPGDCGEGEECRSVVGQERYLTCQPLVLDTP